MTAQLDHARPVAVPGRVGQGTTVEQSRAVAEVQAQVIVAQQFPRSMQASVRAMEEACKQPALAGRALFRYQRGKDPETGEPNILSGPSVHLARELARCWGNVQYGLVELLRDDEHGQSEVMAWAWDMEANTRSSTTFIVPHKRDTRRGAKDLTEMRDIYENNANMGGRRMREMIFAVLPGWFTARALEVCTNTNERGGGLPLPQRIANAVTAFEKHRVSAARIAAKWGYASVDQLTAPDLAQLAIINESLRQGTVSVDDEFPREPALVTAADITGEQPEGQRQRGKRKKAADAGDPTGAAPAGGSAQGQPSPQPPAPAGGATAPPPPAPDPGLPPLPGEEGPTVSGASSSARAPESASPMPNGEPSPSSPAGSGHDQPGSATGPQLTRIWATLKGEFGYGEHERDAAREACARIAGRGLASSKDLSHREAGAVIDALAGCLAVASARDAEPRAVLVALTLDVRNAALAELDRLGITTATGASEWAGRLLDIAPPASLEMLAAPLAVRLAVLLGQCQSRDDLDALLADETVAGDGE